MVTINPLLTGRHHVVSTSIEGGDIGVCVKPSFMFWSIARSPYRCKDDWRQTFLESTTSFGICVNLLQAHTHIDSRSTGIMPVSLQETLRNSLFLESSTRTRACYPCWWPQKCTFQKLFRGRLLVAIGIPRVSVGHQLPVLSQGSY
jgi:hypothetical protein